MDYSVYIVGGAIIVGLVWAIVKKVVEMTPTKKDDEFVAKADPIVQAAVDALDGDQKKP